MPELISRQRDRHTPEIVRDIFTDMSERAHGTVFGGKPSWGYSLPRVKRCSRDGHLSTSWVIDGHEDRRQHRDRLSVKLTTADDVEADAIPVLLSKRPPPPSSLAPAACCSIVTQPRHLILTLLELLPSCEG